MPAGEEEVFKGWIDVVVNNDLAGGGIETAKSASDRPGSRMAAQVGCRRLTLKSRILLAGIYFAEVEKGEIRLKEK
jgi:hypothetical protein